MKWTDEFLVVLAYSTKTQFAIIFAFAFFFGTLLLGHYFVSTTTFHGVLAPMSDVIRAKLEHRYDKVAWGLLFAFTMLAVKCYKKDRKRILGYL